MALPTYYAPAMKAKRASRSAGSQRKVMKSKRVSKIARGRFAKALVFRGSKEKTVGGLKQESLMKNKRGKVVSKRASAQGRRAYKRIEAWVGACVAARAALRVTGFVAINSKTVQGKALYVKAKALMAARAAAQV